MAAGDDWTRRWNERCDAVRTKLGETVPPGVVHSFSWKDHILPGACCLTFKEGATTDGYLSMTLGLTQGVERTDSAYPWEFCIRAREMAEWPVDLLYQLVTQWLCEKGKMGFGYHLPLRFVVGGDGVLWASISQRVDDRQVVGPIRGHYLWSDQASREFETSNGNFSLQCIVAVTEDEDRLAQAATPAHLLLLLRRLAVDQICDPFRQSVLTQPQAESEWAAIEGLAHDEVLPELQTAK
jgi:hypothetical protein